MSNQPTTGLLDNKMSKLIKVIQLTNCFVLNLAEKSDSEEAQMDQFSTAKIK